MTTRKYTASRLRADVYRALDAVAQSGVPIEIERKGKTLRIVVDKPPAKLDRLVKRKAMKCDLDDIVHVDWSQAWKPNL